MTIRDDPNPQGGTVLEFQDEPWSRSAVEPQAVFCGVDVVVDGETCDKLPFVGDAATQHAKLGCRIEVREHADLHAWHRVHDRGGYGRNNALVNFHGQVISFDCNPVSEHHLHYLIDMTGEAPEPVEITMPEGFTLARCYRFDPSSPGGSEADEANVHLLAALGKFAQSFVPVQIRKGFDGYSWAKLPAIGRVEVTVGKELHAGYMWSGTLTCVESLVIAARTSDGKTFSSPVCMAVAPHPPEDSLAWADEHVLITPKGGDRLCASEIWYHLGGWCDEGDTYDTQEYQFQQELDRFWTGMLGPDEQLRRTVVDALALPLTPIVWLRMACCRQNRDSRCPAPNRVGMPPATLPPGSARRWRCVLRVW